MKTPFRTSVIAAVLSLSVFSSFGAWQYTELKRFGRLDQGAQGPDAAVLRAKDGMLYGTTTQGGGQNLGTIYKISRLGAQFQVIHSFTNGYVDGSSPQSPLLEGSDGYLYGTTFDGGSQQAGVAFKISRDGADYQIIHTFGVPTGDGWRPTCPLIEASDGNLYGMTAQGGASFEGVLFQLSKSGDYQIIHTFEGVIGGGSNPLIEGHNGKLYGTCASMNGDGAIFRINKDGTGFELLHQFTGADGSSPSGALMLAPGGRLTGITASGGAQGGGTYFCINKDGSGFVVLANFAAGDGYSRSALVLANDRFYGVSRYGGDTGAGNLFSLSPTNGSFNDLVEFSSAIKIENPVALTAVGPVLYGVADSSVLFEFSPDTGKCRVIHRFDRYGGDGIHPFFKPIFGAGGQLYGTTQEAGPGGGGTVYSIARDGSAYKTRWAFMNSIAATPGGVIADQKGTLFGVTAFGGKTKKASGRGTVFRLDAQGRYKTLHVFTGLPNDGEFPNTPLFEGTDGMLYGSAQFGEYSDVGTRNAIFAVDKNGRNYHVLTVLTNSTVYYFYMSQLSEGADGALYGTFVDTAFKINKDGSGYQPLHVFPAGQYTSTPLTVASDGKMYGATRLDGSTHVGQIYRVNQDGSAFEIIFTFPQDYSLGGNPKGALVEGPDGMLYGSAPGSLTPEIFRLNKDGTGFEVFYVFDHSAPEDGLTLGPDGAWYGTTLDGGPFALGTVFRLNYLPDPPPPNVSK